MKRLKELRHWLRKARERLWAAMKNDDRDAIKRRRKVKDRLAEKVERLENRLRLRWPRRIQVAELLYHSPPHCHFASPERDKLIRIGKIAERRYGLTVTEHPYFDGRVECVHVAGSWHYRDSSAPYVARTCANQGNGLAMDINGTREVEFYNELRRRYG